MPQHDRVDICHGAELVCEIAQYKEIHRLCGPADIIVGLFEQLRRSLQSAPEA